MTRIESGGLKLLAVEVVRKLGSLKLTVLILVALGIGVLLTYRVVVETIWPVVVPLGLCAVNLMAAIATRPIFRRQLPLLGFHLALLLIIILAGIGRLTYLKGQVELVEGQEFDGTLTKQVSGPWHRNNYAQLHFVNEGYTIDYETGVRRGLTQNKVRYLNENGLAQVATIGDTVPLILNGYRFYTSFNKGFAPVFLWHSSLTPGTQPVLGSVNLPAYPIHEYRQALEWVLPGTDITAWTMLQFDEVILDPEKPSEFRLPAKYKVIVRIGDERRELQPGDAIDLPQGRLVFDGLRSWMGYTVFYDWTLHWLLAACVLAVLSMSWHFWRKYASTPWNADHQ